MSMTMLLIPSIASADDAAIGFLHRHRSVPRSVNSGNYFAVGQRQCHLT
jgi:hypothetical protein